MKKEIKRWATFWAPGSFVGESWQRPVESMDPYAVAWPDNAYAFVLCEREDLIDGETRYQGPVTEDKWFYHPDSKVETLAEAMQNPKASETLLSNMRWNDWKEIIWTRWGNWPQPFDSKKMTVLHKEQP